MAQVVATRTIQSSCLSHPGSRSGARGSHLQELKPSLLPARFHHQEKERRRGMGSCCPSPVVAVASPLSRPDSGVRAASPDDLSKEEEQFQHLKSIQQVGEVPNGLWPKPNVMRKTKIVCTIGPSTNTREMIWKLAEAGMNVARMNMSHGDHASHQKVIDLVKEYNEQNKDNVLAIMLDTKGPEVRSGDLPQPITLSSGQEFTFTIKRGVGSETCVSVNYDDFVNDVEVGDMLLVDGGMMSLVVKSKTEDSVKCEVVDGGELKSRRHLNVRGKSATLPSITEKDWDDIKFGVENKVDFYAVSFVKDAKVVHELKDYLKSCNADIHVTVKIESADSIPNLHSIIAASDGAMVARGDLGAELPIEEVPLLQEEIIRICRSMGKAVIVATNMLESMIVHPTPTRAEVSDIAIAVREGSDAIMLSGETAHGKYPLKAVKVMHSVALRTEATMNGGERPANLGQAFKTHMSEMFAYHATMMSNTLGTSIVVFTRSGFMAILLSHYRPAGTIFAFTDEERVRQRLALYQGVCPIYMKFSDDAERTFADALSYLQELGMVKEGEQIALVQSGRQPIWRSQSTHNIQVIAMEPVFSFSGSADQNFEFAFNSSNFSDRVLRIEIVPDSPEDTTGGVGTSGLARHRKRRRADVKKERAVEFNLVSFPHSNQIDDDDGLTGANNEGEAVAMIEEFSSGDELSQCSDASWSMECSPSIRIKSLFISSAILAAKSRFFYKLFSNGMRESDQGHATLRISASEEAALMELLSFMYSGKLSTNSPMLLLDILMAADKFEVASCVKHCSQLLRSLPMSTDTALLYLELTSSIAMSSAIQPLTNAAKEFLAKSFKDLTKHQDGLIELPLVGVEAVLSSDELQVASEDAVYDFVLKWARHHYPDLEERREILSSHLSHLIRFPYMSCRKLRKVVTQNDLDQEIFSKAVLEALFFKAETPHRQRALALEQSSNRRYAERAYKYRPVKAIEFELPHPQCIVYLDLKQEECAHLFPSGRVYSQAFHLGGQGFFLSAHCNMDQQSSFHCFGLFLGMQEKGSVSFTVDYEFAARAKPSGEFISKYKGYYTFTGGKAVGYRNLFAIPWTSFMADDSLYFINGVLHLRAELTIKQQQQQQQLL
ncbi:unnamed protein product [Musa banksii]